MVKATSSAAARTAAAAAVGILTAAVVLARGEAGATTAEAAEGEDKDEACIGVGAVSADEEEEEEEATTGAVVGTDILTGVVTVGEAGVVATVAVGLVPTTSWGNGKAVAGLDEMPMEAARVKSNPNRSDAAAS